ncbi:MAG: hypothetical protein H8E82_06540 [Candidatus Marinimicrobia bacterium]|nr:hypothetical protein [Candidatus Neomarinimicrobiota bacterium]MBL7046436.1 hypothetical protein [Candidatus Neomarinimicrobiota bacterium]
MPDINLFGIPGFQKRNQKPKPVQKNKKVIQSEEETSSPRFYFDNVVSAIIAIIIFLFLLWFFVVKTKVQLEIKEYTPEQYKLKENIETRNVSPSDPLSALSLKGKSIKIIQISDFKMGSSSTPSPVYFKG